MLDHKETKDTLVLSFTKPSSLICTEIFCLHVGHAKKDDLLLLCSVAESTITSFSVLYLKYENTSFGVRASKKLNFPPEYFSLLYNENYILLFITLPFLSWLLGDSEPNLTSIIVIFFGLIFGNLKYLFSALIFPLYFIILLHVVLYFKTLLEMKSLCCTCLATVSPEEHCQNCVRRQLLIT